MMEKIYLTLSTIYTNRYRELTNKDASAFYIPFILYFITLYKIYAGTFPSFPQLDITTYILMTFSFSISVYVNNRKDSDLLHLIFGKIATYFILFLDLLFINIIQLIVCIKTNQYNALSFTLVIILFFTFYKNRINTPLFKSVLHPLNTLLKIQLRKYKFIYILIFICYYLAFQGLKENNLNLFIIANIGVIYILFDIISKPEKLDYFILSKFNNKEYLLKNEFAFFMDYLKFILPIFIFSLIIKPEFSLYLLISFLLIPCLFPLKYIHYNQRIILAFTSFFIICFGIYICIELTSNYWMLIILIILSYTLHQVAFRKFTKDKIQEYSEFYL